MIANQNVFFITVLAIIYIYQLILGRDWLISIFVSMVLSSILLVLDMDKHDLQKNIVHFYNHELNHEVLVNMGIFFGIVFLLAFLLWLKGLAEVGVLIIDLAVWYIVVCVAIINTEINYYMFPLFVVAITGAMVQGEAYGNMASIDKF